MQINLAWSSHQEDGTRTLSSQDRILGTILPFRSDLVTAKDALEQIEQGVFRWTRTFVYRGGASGECRLMMEFLPSYAPEYYMIPAVSYNGNEWGKGLEPKGLEQNGEPWTYAWHRTAVAGATYSEGEGWSVALFGQPPADMNGFSCSLAPVHGQVIHRLVWPEEESPAVYSDRDQYSKEFRSKLLLSPGQTFTAVAYLVIERCGQPRMSWRRMLDVAWRMQNRPYKPAYDPSRIWELAIDYARNGLWNNEDKGFSVGMHWKDDNWLQARSYEIGWCGQNASLANSFLADYLRTGNPDSKEKGLTVLDQWVEKGRMSNGLIHCILDFALFKQGQPKVQDACNLGTAALQLFEAEELARLCGEERPLYREAALGLCDFAVSAQLSDGRLGKSWSNDGDSIDPDGTVGCFLVPPLVRAFEITGDSKYLDSAEAGYRYYIRGLLEDGYTSAGALDTYCIDKESSIPLLKAGLSLFRMTGNRVYLEWAEHAAWYLASWQWHHTVPYGEDCELGRMKYDTFGGTAVSVQHHHIDPYGLAFVEDWLALAELTGNLVWKERAMAIWENAAIGISDGRLTVMGKSRPAGSQDEGFYHTRWKNTFQVSQWLVAWPTAFRLEVLRRVTFEKQRFLIKQ